MAWSITDIIPPWGDSGERWSNNFQYQGGDQVNEKHLDYFISSVGTLEDDVRAALTDIDSDADGIVDEADTANLYKGNDIDSNGDGTVDDSDLYRGLGPSDGTSGQFLKTDGTAISWASLPTNTETSDASGVVDTGDAANVYSAELADGDSLDVVRATFMHSDGTAVASGCDLIIATLDNTGGGTSQVTILSGDGSTVYDESTGTPLAQYTNTSGAAQTVMVAVDNGNFNTGSGSAQDVVTVVEVQQ